MVMAAQLALSARRYQPRVWTMRFIGWDLTGVDLRMQVRMRPDTPGAPLIDLGTVTSDSAEGLNLAGVTTEGGVPVSEVRGRIDKSTMDNLPYLGEVGDDAVFAYSIALDGQTRLYGPFAAIAEVMDADDAPTNRPSGFGGQRSHINVWEAATLTIGDDTISVSIDGVAQLATLVQTAQTAVSATASNATRAETARAGSEGAFAQFMAAIADEKMEGPFATKAEMDAAVASITDYAQVIADETQGGTRTIYRKIDDVMVYQIDASGVARTLRVSRLSSEQTGKFILYQNAENGRSEAVTAIGRNAAVPVAITKTVGSFTNGSAAEPTYMDTIMSIGINIQENTQPQNPDMPSQRYGFESMYSQGASGGEPAMCEYHVISQVPATSYFPGAGEYRGLSATVMHDPANYELANNQMAHRFAQHIFLDGRGNPRVQMRFISGVSQVDFIGRSAGSEYGHAYAAAPPPRLSFGLGSNNLPMVLQMNAAGNALLPYPYPNAQNRFQTELPIQHVTSSTVDATFGKNCIEVKQHVGAPSGSTMVFKYADVAGNYTIDEFAGGVAGTLTAQRVYNAGPGPIRNLLLAQTTGAAFQTVQIEGIGGGEWSAGIDGATREWRLANSQALGSRIAMSVPIGANPRPVFPNGVNLLTELHVAGTKVVGQRQPAIANPTDAASNIAATIAILDAMRAHGLIQA